MASKKIEELPNAAPLTGAVLIHVAEPNGTGGYNSRSVSLAELLAEVVPAAGISQATADGRYFRTRAIAIQVLGSVPSASEILALYPAIDAFTIPANLAGSKVSVITNPTAAFVITLLRQVNGAGAFASIGTISIATDGTVTLASAGGAAITIAAGDVIKATADADGDTTFIGSATIKGVP